jgi:DNA-binding HxlR family transcriptional regulator
MSASEEVRSMEMLSHYPSHQVAAQRPARQERLRARPEDFEMIDRTRDALALLQSKWAVDVVFLLASGIRRHARLVDNAPGLSKKVLTATLRKLEDDGLVSRSVYAEIPVRVEYRLTPLGWQLTELLMALYEWATEHESEITKRNELSSEEALAGQALLGLHSASAA